MGRTVWSDKLADTVKGDCGSTMLTCAVGAGAGASEGAGAGVRHAWVLVRSLAGSATVSVGAAGGRGRAARGLVDRASDAVVGTAGSGVVSAGVVSAGMLAQALSTSVAAMAPKRLQGVVGVAARGAVTLAGSINRGMRSFNETTRFCGPQASSRFLRQLSNAHGQSGKKGLAGSRSFGIWED